MLQLIQRLMDYFTFGAFDDLGQCAEAHRLANLCAQILQRALPKVSSQELKGSSLVESLEYLEKSGFVVLSTEKGVLWVEPARRLRKLEVPPIVELRVQVRWGLTKCLGSFMPQRMQGDLMLQLYTDLDSESLALLKKHKERIMRQQGGRELMNALSRYHNMPKLS